jgi:hypothetical protein
MIEVNIPSPNLKRIVEKTLEIANDWVDLSEQQLSYITQELAAEFRDKMVTTVWSIDNFTPLTDQRNWEELSLERKRLIARRAMRIAENDFDPDEGLCWTDIKSYLDNAKYQIELDEQADAQQNKAK